MNCSTRTKSWPKGCTRQHPVSTHSCFMHCLCKACRSFRATRCSYSTKSCWQLPPKAITHTAESTQHTAHAVVQEARPTKSGLALACMSAWHTYCALRLSHVLRSAPLGSSSSCCLHAPNAPQLASQGCAAPPTQIRRIAAGERGHCCCPCQSAKARVHSVSAALPS